MDAEEPPDSDRPTPTPTVWSAGTATSATSTASHCVAQHRIALVFARRFQLMDGVNHRYRLHFTRLDAGKHRAAFWRV